MICPVENEAGVTIYSVFLRRSIEATAVALIRAKNVAEMHLFTVMKLSNYLA